MDSFLLQLFIFLFTATIAVPIAKKLGLGSILGYLIAGIIIGPYGFSLISHVEEVMNFTEFGVVMMLFLVGLELKPSLLWQMRVSILGMGGLQVALSSLLIALIAFIFLPWQQALSIGLILSLSSTAIVLQTMRENGLMNTDAGKSVFSVLLFQDLAVIPMLALLPFLSNGSHASAANVQTGVFNINVLPGYLQIIIIIFAIFTVYFIGKFLCTPIFRAVAATRIREIFVAAALALVVGISLLMELVGLSPALGAFLAGVVLADSEYRHEIESDIEPFKGLLLGVFFISVGASFNLKLIGEKAFLILGITIGLILLKCIVLDITRRIFKMRKKEGLLFTIALAQGGEFAFVLFQFAKLNGILSSLIIDPLVSAVAISMFITPFLFKAYEKFSNDSTCEHEEQRTPDVIEKQEHRVILAGFGRLGTDVGRFLMAAGIKTVIVDNDAINVDVLRKFGFEVYYGDITRLDLLEAAGISKAELLIITISNIEVSRKLIELTKKHYPNIKIISNAYNRDEAYELMDLGITNIKRETCCSAVSIGRDALQLLGTEPYQAYRMMSIFNKHDESMMPELYKKYHEGEDSYISSYQQHLANLEELMALDKSFDIGEIDKAWTRENSD